MPQQRLRNIKSNVLIILYVAHVKQELIWVGGLKFEMYGLNLTFSQFNIGFVFDSLTSCENTDDRYMTVFHPVASDDRITVPSHAKRFSVKMFTFLKDEEVLKDEVTLRFARHTTLQSCM